MDLKLNFNYDIAVDDGFSTLNKHIDGNPFSKLLRIFTALFLTG